MKRLLVFVFCLCSFFLFFEQLYGVDVVLLPSMDNTIFSEDGNASGAAGKYIYLGRNFSINYIRRGLIAFDLTGTIPHGSVINSAQLSLFQPTINYDVITSNVRIYKALASWGEAGSVPTSDGSIGGPAQPGDATWIYNCYNSLTWAAPGGDYVSNYSATASINNTLKYFVWGSNAAMIADVQSWVNHPNENFGWLIKGDEGQNFTDRKFYSRNFSEVNYRPKLTVDYTPPIDVTLINGSDFLLGYESPEQNVPCDNWPLGQFCLTGAGTGASLTNVTIALNGDYSGTSGGTPFCLYASNSDDFATAVSVSGNINADAGILVFTGMNDNIPNGTRYYWVTCDLQSSSTMRGVISSSADFELRGGAITSNSSFGFLNVESMDETLPVHLVEFKGTVNDHSIHLNWITSNQVDNLGFWLEKKETSSDTWILLDSYKTNVHLQGRNNSLYERYCYKDENVQPDHQYTYRLHQTDINGKDTIIGEEIMSINKGTLENILFPAYPNPFNPETRITYRLSRESAVSLKVYDLTGRLIEILEDHIIKEPGEYIQIWSADKDNSVLPTGIYFIQLLTNDFTATRKVLLVR